MMLEEEIVKLRVENAMLRQLVEELTAEIESLKARLAELEKQKPGMPSFVKANRPKRTKKGGGQEEAGSGALAGTKARRTDAG